MLNQLLHLSPGHHSHYQQDPWPPHLVGLRPDLDRLTKVAKVFKAAHVKLVIALGPGAEAQQLRTRVLYRLSAVENWDFKKGKQPPTNMVRVPSAWLEDMDR